MEAWLQGPSAVVALPAACLVNTGPYKGTTLSLRPAAIAYTSKGGGVRIDLQHKYYVALHINLLVIYIARMISLPIVPLLTKRNITK
jgi:hypothetical protein